MKTKARKPALTVDVADMRSEIAKLTGKLPTSFDRRYLQNRLSALRQLKPAELPNQRVTTDPAVTLSISLPQSECEALKAEAAEKRVGVSSIVRDALFDSRGKRIHR